MVTQTERRLKKTKADAHPFRATIKVSQTELASACRFLLPALDPDGARYNLNSVCLSFDPKGRPVLSATDGRRAHVATLSAPAEIIGHAPPFQSDGSSHAACLIPREIIRELADMPKANKWPQTGEMVLRVSNGGLSFTFYKSKRTHCRAMRWEKGRFPRIADVIGPADLYHTAGKITGDAHDLRQWLNPEPRIMFAVSDGTSAAYDEFPKPAHGIKSEGAIVDMFDATYIRAALVEMAGGASIVSMGPQGALHIRGGGGEFRYGSTWPQQRSRLEFRAVVMPLHRDR